MPNAARKYKRRWVEVDLLKPTVTRLDDGSEKITREAVRTFGVRRDFTGSLSEEADSQLPIRRTQFMVHRNVLTSPLLEGWINWKLQAGNSEFAILGVRENPFNPQIYLDIDVEFQGRSSMLVGILSHGQNTLIRYGSGDQFLGRYVRSS